MNKRATLFERFLLLFKKNHFGFDYDDGKVFVCRCKKLFGKLYYIEEQIFEIKPRKLKTNNIEHEGYVRRKKNVK